MKLQRIKNTQTQEKQKLIEAVPEKIQMLGLVVKDFLFICLFFWLH